MICEFCSNETVEKKVKRLHWHNKKLYIVENVPAQVCRACGERYFHATDLDEIDRMIETGFAVKERLEVAVMTM